MRSTFMNAASLVGVAVMLAGAPSAAAPPVASPEQTHLDRARALAGSDFGFVYDDRCGAARGSDPDEEAATSGRGRRGARPEGAAPGGAGQRGARPTGPRPSAPPPEPGRAFDNLYFVGASNVSTWALKTSEGILLFDALNRPEDAQNIIIPGMTKMGLDPKQVKGLIIMHGHGDHYGAANALKEQLGTPIYMSEAEWTFLDKFKAGALPASIRAGPDAWKTRVPVRDRVITDGHVMRMGDTTVTFYVTPGHTPGSVSAIITTSDKGRPHTIAFWGGTGYPAGAADLKQYDQSLARFMAIAKAAGADAVISNHSRSDNSLKHLEVMRTNPGGPNPFLLGVDGVQRMYGVLKECGLAQAARLGT